jgi:hypothetical protein
VDRQRESELERRSHGPRIDGLPSAPCAKGDGDRLARPRHTHGNALVSVPQVAFIIVAQHQDRFAGQEPRPAAVQIVQEGILVEETILG